MAVRLSLVMTLAAGIALFASAPASAQSPPAAKPEMRENCPGLVASKAPRVIPAAFQHSALKTRVNALQLALNPDQVRISYSGHSTFLVESPQLVRVATDYNDYVRPMVLPDIATMNHAHSTHYTDRPDPRIPHVLRGWGPSPEQPARHDVQVRDVRGRNVPTNIRDWAGGTERHGNSIFIYEMANMCIAHLGHLHHTLTQQQLDEIGRIDIVFAPVDGTLTLDTDGMIDVLQSMKAQLIIPMHFFSSFTLHRFLDVAKNRKWDVEFAPVPTTTTSKTTLPANPKVLVLPGR
jgi:L-ascorbate metabolism protein UlaG (beta-lactamase superfamily)